MRPLSGSSPRPDPARSERPRPTGDAIHYVFVCALDDHRVGLPLDRVEAIESAAAFDPLPDAPAHVDGVVNIHGDVRPVLDLRGRFGLAPEPLHPSQHFVLARTQAQNVAVRVDRALGVTGLAVADLRQARAVTGSEGATAEVGILEDGLVVVHDLDAFLAAGDATRLAEALARLRDGAGAGAAGDGEEDAAG